MTAEVFILSCKYELSTELTQTALSEYFQTSTLKKPQLVLC